MKSMYWIALLSGVVLLTGCAGPAAFTSVDLERDLSASDIARYQSKLSGAPVSSHGEHGHMMTLERMNRWPLGLIAYWKSGTVRAMHSPGGTSYMVSKSRGIGPLAVLYASKEEAVYNEKGKRQSYMKMGSLVYGHLAMNHVMGARMDDGQWMQHWSSGIAHHLINIGEGHDGRYYSLLSDPNPISVGE